ncbi:HNH endonuclease signature motif containing protein [Streptococcus pluranimalium]|uniref:HNH endonuclease signature motif containing protein n=1 Tax=Streptococcus pluranimalium TaxID=82348 RepID=UPI003F68EE4C
MFKEIPNYNSRYSINENGQIINNERGNIVKPMVSTSSYHYVHLVKDKKKTTKYVHRLVGEVFLENPKNSPQIDHIDGDKLNNSATNLRWVSASQNSLAYGSKQRAEARKRKVVAVFLDGTEIIFESRKSAAEHFNCSPSKIKYDHLYQKGNKKGWIFSLK